MRRNPEKDAKLVQEIVAVIDANIIEPLKVSELCELFGLKQDTMYLIFHRHMKMTPAEYAIKARIEHTKRLISEEGLHKRELADRLDCNANYLSRRFKKETGMTLTEYLHSTRKAA